MMNLRRVEHVIHTNKWKYENENKIMLNLLAMSPPEAGNISDIQPWDSIKDIIIHV